MLRIGDAILCQACEVHYLVLKEALNSPVQLIAGSAPDVSSRHIARFAVILLVLLGWLTVALLVPIEIAHVDAIVLIIESSQQNTFATDVNQFWPLIEIIPIEIHPLLSNKVFEAVRL